MREVEELLGLAFHLEPNVLMLLVARYPGDPLDEVEDGRRRMPFFIEHRADDLRGLSIREAALAQEGGAVVVIASDNPLACRPR